MTPTPSTSLTTSQDMPKRSEPNKEELKKEFMQWCFHNGIGSVLMADELLRCFDWFHTLLSHSQEQARDEAIKKFRSLVDREEYEWDRGEETWNKYIKSLGSTK